MLRSNGLRSFIWSLNNGTLLFGCLHQGTLLSKLARLRVVPVKNK